MLRRIPTRQCRKIAPSNYACPVPLVDYLDNSLLICRPKVVNAKVIAAVWLVQLHQWNFSNDDSKSPSPHIPKNRVIDVIRHDLVRFFDDGFELDYSIYRPDIVFKVALSHDPVTISSSLKHYKLLCTCLRWSCRMSLSNATLVILSIRQENEGDHFRITVRWLLQGTPIIPTLPAQYEGVFVYLVFKEFVYEHILETISPIPTFMQFKPKLDYRVC